MENRLVRLFSQLPDHLKEEILKRLPVECLCRSRPVCHEWNSLFSSTRFITTEWADFPSNRKPWLVLCERDCRRRCWAYCFSTRTWKPYFSLCFLDEKFSHAYYHGSGSAAGLLFVEMLFCQKRSVWNDLIVCNPLTGRSVMLPVPSSMRAPSSMAVVLAKGIVAGECDGNRQTYKVVAVCQVPGGEQGAGKRGTLIQSVEIYDSSEESWTTARYVPEKVSVILDHRKVCFSDGYLYCSATLLGRSGIVGLSLQNDSSLFAPLPDLVNGNMVDQLVSCGSRILLVGWLLEDETKILNEVHIWELLKVKVDSQIHVSWLEIARMPTSIREDVWRIWPEEQSFLFEGVGSCVCVRGRASMKMVVYSLTENSWSWLPSCPSSVSGYFAWNSWVYSFEPRPDVKVS